MHEITERLARAALLHVPFDGWSEVTFRAACRDTATPEALARLHVPRGALDLALAAHQLGDAELRARLAALDLTGLRLRERMVQAVMLRLDAAGDREVVRRASALFALPQHAAAGARAIWQTADVIWTSLGDASQDLNWYSKRAILAGIYGATVLYWLGDDSVGAQATRDFVTRRIEGVMTFEAGKARLRAHPLTAPLMALQARLAGCVRAPGVDRAA